MKRVFLIFIFIISSTPALADLDIVYLDIQYIIDKSDLGKFYKDKINLAKSENYSKIKINQNEIKELDNEIKSKKNILKNDELKVKINKLNKLILAYQNEKREIDININKKKKEYSSKILKHLNPLITSYVEKNNISLVIDKKSILVGAKSQDITLEILNMLNIETTKQDLMNES